MKKKTATPKVNKNQPSTGAEQKVAVKTAFTHDRYKELNTQMLRKMELIEEKEGKAKADMASVKADIKVLRSEVTNLGNQLRNGYEDVMVNALVQYDRKAWKKHYFVEEPGAENHKQFIRTEDMTEEDAALLPFEGSSASVPLGGEKPKDDKPEPEDPGNKPNPE